MSTTTESVTKLSNAVEVLLPEKPVEPLDSECCGTGCTPCVFDIYKKQLIKWEVECDKIRRNEVASLRKENLYDDAQLDPSTITPYEYKLFRVIDVVKDTADSIKLFKFDSNPVLCGSCEAVSNYNSIDSVFPVEIGQHVVLKIDQHSRQYTVLRVFRTVESCQFEILIKIYPEGQLTQLLNKINIGSSLQMRGPFGHRYEYKPNQFYSLVMLVAGTGFAPLYRIIEMILENECDETRIKLLFSCKSVADIFLRSKFIEWSSFWNFQAFYYFSSQAADSAPVPYGMSVQFQRLNLDEIRAKCKMELTSHPKNTQYLICGTKSFEKDMINYLTKLEVKSELVHVF